MPVAFHDQVVGTIFSSTFCGPSYQWLGAWQFPSSCGSAVSPLPKERIHLIRVGIPREGTITPEHFVWWQLIAFYHLSAKEVRWCHVTSCSTERKVRLRKIREKWIGSFYVKSPKKISECLTGSGHWNQWINMRELLASLSLHFLLVLSFFIVPNFLFLSSNAQRYRQWMGFLELECLSVGF